MYTKKINCPLKNQKRNGDRGVALLLILWVITFLSIICAEFSWTMRTETVTAHNFKDAAQAYYAAEAGINRAVVELRRAGEVGQKKITSLEEEEEATEAEQSYWFPGSGPYRFEFGGGSCEVAIEDERNKIKLNDFLEKAKSNPLMLKNLLEEKIGLQGEKRDIIADSLIDWRDSNHNITGVNGAEDDYYADLDPPYECRDDKIPVIEELLLVRGVDEAVFYGKKKGRAERKSKLTREELERMLSGSEENHGDEEESARYDNETGVPLADVGLVHLFSTMAGSSSYPPTVDINTASVDQLIFLNGMDRQTAAKIVQERRRRPFDGKADPRLRQFKHYEVWQKDIKVSRSNVPTLGYYRLISTGYSPDGTLSRTISCNLVLTKSRFVVYNWKTVN